MPLKLFWNIKSGRFYYNAAQVNSVGLSWCLWSNGHLVVTLLHAVQPPNPLPYRFRGGNRWDSGPLKKKKYEGPGIQLIILSLKCEMDESKAGHHRLNFVQNSCAQFAPLHFEFCCRKPDSDCANCAGIQWVVHLPLSKYNSLGWGMTLFLPSTWGNSKSEVSSFFFIGNAMYRFNRNICNASSASSTPRPLKKPNGLLWLFLNP